MAEFVDCNFESIFNLPFTSINNVELNNLNSSNSTIFLNSLPSLDIVSEVSKFSNFQPSDIDINMAFQTDCKYYSVDDYKKIRNNRYFNIFHSNINSLEAKFDNFHEFLSSISSKFGILAITETSEKVNVGFRKKIEIEGYKMFSTASNINKGGTAIYIDRNFDSFERMDLKIQDDNYESTWCEIKNTNSKNIVTGCIYRHPRYNVREFFSYFEKCLNKLSRENKEIYICGDFNLDLLKIEEDNSYLEFYNLLCSYGFLPKIIHPTRVTDHNSSLIDNIFSNNLSDITISGNILLTLSEHFSQFLSVKRGIVEYSNTKL